MSGTGRVVVAEGATEARVGDDRRCRVVPQRALERLEPLSGSASKKTTLTLAIRQETRSLFRRICLQTGRIGVNQHDLWSLLRAQDAQLSVGPSSKPGHLTGIGPPCLDVGASGY